MVTRLFAIVGILFALFGVLVAPRLISSTHRRRPQPLHRFNPDDGDAPWDLTNWIPVGFVAKREWHWMPRLKILK